MKIKVKVRVIAGAKKEEVKQEEGFLKIKVTSPPVKGKANEAVIRALAEHFDVPKSRIIITKGQTSNKKEVEIATG